MLRDGFPTLDISWLNDQSPLVCQFARSFTDTIPSTTSYDLTTANEAYFERVDAMLNLAAG